jgi:DDE domain
LGCPVVSVSFRDVERILADRVVSVDHTTMSRWKQRYAPEIEKRVLPHLRMTNGSWRVDETYIKVKGRWTYLYRAVDSRGQTIDFLISARRDAAAARRFFRKALKQRHIVRPPSARGASTRIVCAEKFLWHPRQANLDRPLRVGGRTVRLQALNSRDFLMAAENFPRVIPVNRPKISCVDQVRMTSGHRISSRARAAWRSAHGG